VSIIQGFVMINLHHDILDIIVSFSSVKFSGSSNVKIFMPQLYFGLIFAIYFQFNFIFIWKEEKKLKVIVSYILPIIALLPGSASALLIFFNKFFGPLSIDNFDREFVEYCTYVCLFSFFYLTIFHLVKWHFKKKKQRLLAE
jgi:hypothetical protein